MDVGTIRKIQAMYRELREGPGTGSHERVKQVFGLTDAQEYAINVFGRDWELSAETLVEHIGKVRDGMTIGQIAVALGCPAEAALDEGVEL